MIEQDKSRGAAHRHWGVGISERSTRLPVHRVLPQDRRRNRTSDASALAHTVVGRKTLVELSGRVRDLREAAQRVCSEVEAATTLATNTVLVKVATVGTGAVVCVLDRLLEALVGELPALLDRAHGQEREHDKRDRAEGADNTNDRVPARV